MTVFIRVTTGAPIGAGVGRFETSIRRSKAIVSCHLMAASTTTCSLPGVSGVDDYGRLHQNELSRLPGVTRLETRLRAARRARPQVTGPHRQLEVNRLGAARYGIVSLKKISRAPTRLCVVRIA